MTLVEALDIAGVAAFAVSGCLVALRARMDLVGVSGPWNLLSGGGHQTLPTHGQLATFRGNGRLGDLDHRSSVCRVCARDRGALPVGF